MDMVKVDPKLFITCRLCLKEMGMYQITPSVQQQIKFCFDIEVNQFDGLPQLICSDCEAILSDYSTKKRLFVGMQNALKAKLEVRREVEKSPNSPPHEAVTSSQPNDDESPPISRRTHFPKKRKVQILSSGSDSEPPSRATTASPAVSNKEHADDSKLPQKKKRGSKTRRESWMGDQYIKKFACKLCNRTFKFVGGSHTNHTKAHAALIAKHKDILNKFCNVKMVKIDGKLNPTGCKGLVALSEDKILGDTLRNDYIRILYIPKNNDKENNIQNVSKTVESDDSDSIVTKQHGKRRRLASVSSTDTVIVETKSRIKPVGHSNSPIECINIDDSSNSTHHSDSESNQVDDYQPIDPKDVETMSNIIRACHARYMSRKKESIELDKNKKDAKKDPKLKHKLLSMGRKVINKQGLSCTGLLRFMENRDLAVKWTPMLTLGSQKDYVHIMPRLKDKVDKLSGLGWKKRPEITDEFQEILPRLDNNPETSAKDRSLPIIDCGADQISRQVISSDKTPIETDFPSTSFVGNVVPNKSTSPVISTPILGSQPNSSATLLLFDMLSDNNTDKKLLNANPVANPKQLPKKFCVDSKTNSPNLITNPTSIKQQSNTVCNTDSLCIDLDEDAQPVSDMCMPIITSTTSLAASSTDDKTVTENATDLNPTSSTDVISRTNGDAENPAPRIKVKPASELMSESVLKTLGHQHPALWAQNVKITPGPVPHAVIELTPIPHLVPMVAVANNITNNAITNNNSNSLTEQSAATSYVILHTVEMPNTKTSSPIQYVSKLLLMHNINLLEYNQPLPPNVFCLVKFKLQLVRDDRNMPVTLCLSVHCSGNTFALGVRDPSQFDSIDLNKLSANWQWEILKIYTVREDVIKKMLDSAQKVNQEVYDNTKKLLCLLKTITFKKVDDLR